MTNYSPNMLKTFKSCPLKYKFKYIDRISLPQKASFFEKGKKVHALANYYLKGDDISKFEPTLNENEKIAWNNLKSNEFFSYKYVNSEYNLSCKIGDYWIGGRLDAIVKKHKNESETYYILDYKTGSIPQNPEYDYQTMVYLLCLSSAPFITPQDQIKFVYIDLKNNQNCVIDFTQEKKLEYEKAITTICSNIENIQIPEDIEHQKMCDFCEYKKICM
jgi:CRISPR/Cas system-associated exonuclease Cas4 (RecB family)